MSASGRPSLGDVVSAATLAVAFLTAWLYVTGWSYVYDYFDRFRIPLLMVELPIEHYFVYGGLVVRKNLEWSIAIAVVLIGLAWTSVWWMGAISWFGACPQHVLGRKKMSASRIADAEGAAAPSESAVRLTRVQSATLLVLAVIVLFALGRWAGIATAAADFLAERDQDYPAYPRIALVLKKGVAEAVGARFADLPTTDCGRLVLFSRNQLFIVRPVRAAPGTNLDSFVVPADQVEAFRITGEYRSCH